MGYPSKDEYYLSKIRELRKKNEALEASLLHEREIKKDNSNCLACNHGRIMCIKNESPHNCTSYDKEE